MKKIIALIITACAFAIAAYADSKTKAHGIVNVKDELESKEAIKESAAGHKPYDVEVARTILMGNSSYKVNFYREDKGTLKYYGAYYGSNENMDKASYKWLNDTMVAIRLYSSTSKKELNFKVFGNGSTSGLVKPD